MANVRCIWALQKREIPWVKIKPNGSGVLWLSLSLSLPDIPPTYSLFALSAQFNPPPTYARDTLVSSRNPYLDADVASHAIFFPILDTDAMAKNAPGNKGVNNSTRLAACMTSVPLNRYQRGSESKRSLIAEAYNTPPNWPRPSFKIQFIEAANYEVNKGSAC